MELRTQVLDIFYSVLKVFDSSIELDVLKNTLSFDEPLAEKFDLDSLSMIEFYLLIQDSFDIEINDEEYEKLLTLNDILTRIKP